MIKTNLFIEIERLYQRYYPLQFIISNDGKKAIYLGRGTRMYYNFDNPQSVMECFRKLRDEDYNILYKQTDDVTIAYFYLPQMYNYSENVMHYANSINSSLRPLGFKLYQ